MSSTNPKKILRKEFDALSPADQMAHVKDGGTVVDSLTRAEFDKLRSLEQERFTRSGGIIR